MGLNIPTFSEPASFLRWEMGWDVPGQKEPLLESCRDAEEQGGCTLIAFLYFITFPIFLWVHLNAVKEIKQMHSAGGH